MGKSSKVSILILNILGILIFIFYKNILENPSLAILNGGIFFRSFSYIGNIDKDKRWRSLAISSAFVTVVVPIWGIYADAYSLAIGLSVLLVCASFLEIF